MPDLRWYLKRDGADVALVCERRIDKRGYTFIYRDVSWASKVAMRRELRRDLPELARLAGRISMVPPSLRRTYSPEEVDA